jgi:hypothetical protein
MASLYVCAECKIEVNKPLSCKTEVPFCPKCKRDTVKCDFVDWRLHKAIKKV